MSTFRASLLNPDDPAEVTLVADAVSVGKTHRLASGQVIRWSPEILRATAASFLGRPVNIALGEDGQATGHSRRTVGSVTKAFFDERKQVITVHAALWVHYYRSTVRRIKELAAAGSLQCSMEFVPRGEMRAEADGSVTPSAGVFSGLALVRRGADPRNRVLLVAAMAEDEERSPMPPAGPAEPLSDATRMAVLAAIGGLGLSPEVRDRMERRMLAPELAYVARLYGSDR